MRPRFRVPRRGAPSFSLIELLVVVAIMCVLTAVSIPAYRMVRAHALDLAGQVMVGEFDAARQAALTRNLPVEVRVYLLPDYNAPPTSAPAVYRALQYFLISGTNAVPLIKASFFPSPIVCSTNTAESSFPTLLTVTAPSAGASPVGAYGTNFKYVSFRITPNGSLDQLTQMLYFTLTQENAAAPSQGGDFLTVQVDPFIGRIQTFKR